MSNDLQARQTLPADIAGLARDTVAGFAVEAAGRGVQLLIDAPDDLAPIDLDPIRIREVIGNLLSNALRHTPAGGYIGVTVRASRGPNSESRLAVEIRDSGAGMTADDLAHAFDRFYKGSKSRRLGIRPDDCAQSCRGTWRRDSRLERTGRWHDHHICAAFRQPMNPEA
jgi:signal transduction histidine kinase